LEDILQKTKKDERVVEQADKQNELTAKQIKIAHANVKETDKIEAIKQTTNTLNGEQRFVNDPTLIV
jgi:hypothetical protein